MSLQYILGASGSGKSHYLYENVIEESIRRPDTSFFIIVPEQFTMSTQKKVIQMHPMHGIMNVDIVSFPRLAHRIFGETGVSTRQILDDTGKSLVLRKIIENNKDKLSYFARNIGKSGFVEEMKSVISEFLQYSVTPGIIHQINENLSDNPILKYKLEDISVLYDGFQSYIKDKYIASEELLQVLCNVIPASELIKDSVVVLDGFTGFTPVQYRLLGILMTLCSEVKIALSIDSSEQINVIEGMDNLFYMCKTTASKINHIADENGIEIIPPVKMKDTISYRLRETKALSFMEKNIFRNHTSVYREPVDNEIAVFEGRTPKSEIDFVVGEIKRLVTAGGCRYSEIAVISGDVANYGYLAGNIMEQNNIPCFVDYKRSIMSNVLVEYIRSAIEIAEYDFTYESVFRMLKTGLTPIDDKDIDELENYVLAFGISGFRKWSKQWNRAYRTPDRKNITTEYINDIRSRVMDIAGSFYEAVKNKKTIREYAQALYEFINMSQLQKKAAEYAQKFEQENDISMAGEYRQCYVKIMELLDKIVVLMGDEKVSFLEFGEILDAGFDEIKVGLIPQKKDSVIIGDIERSRLDNIKVMFLVGVNDGNIPKTSDGGGILSEIDRDIISEMNVELAPGERENAFIQKFYLYLTLTKPSKRLYLTYSRYDTEGKSLKVSYLIGVIRKLFPAVNIYNEKTAGKVISTVKIPKAAFDWTGILNDRINSENAEKMYGDVLSKSVSRIEMFYKCAFAHFAKYGLSLREREISEIKQTDIGSIYHKVIELISYKIIAKGIDFTSVTKEECMQLIDEAFEEIEEEYASTQLYDSERGRHLIERFKNMAYITIWSVAHQLEHGKFKPKHFEMNFKTKDNIIGKIDRIDTYEDDENIYVKVVDYKTGTTQLDITQMYYGLQIQLITYMQAALLLEEKAGNGKTAVPAGMFYYNIKTPFASDDSSQEAIDKELLEELRMNGMVNGEDKAIDALENEKDGKSVAIPASFKDGQVRQDKNILSREQFGLLAAHTQKLIENAAKEMEDGAAQIKPYRFDDRTGCDYCPFGAVCGFDSRMEGFGYRNIKKMDIQELWGKLGEEDGE